MTRILLHSCCGPCSTSVIERLLKDYDEILVYYYNPNIYPKDEYIRRKEEQKIFVEKMALKYNVSFFEGDYDKSAYYTKIEGHEGDREGGERCHLCYELRMSSAAKLAKQLNFDCFTTTLTVSPHKNSTKIFEIGYAIEEKEGIKFLDLDFKKQNGYLRSTILAKENNMYRQSYCGCEFAIEHLKKRELS